MNRVSHKGKARCVTPARAGWANQWQPNGPVTITKIECKKCPSCGKFLIKRTGRYGEFYGCKGYPECNYIEKINQKTHD